MPEAKLLSGKTKKHRVTKETWHVIVTGTYANRLLTPRQTEQISLLVQLEASSSCLREEGKEKKGSLRITIGVRAKPGHEGLH